jgi:hypothetical protein
LIAPPRLASAKSVIKSHTTFGFCFVAGDILNDLLSVFYILINIPGVAEEVLETLMLNNSIDTSADE